MLRSAAAIYENLLELCWHVPPNKKKCPCRVQNTDVTGFAWWRKSRFNQLRLLSSFKTCPCPGCPGCPSRLWLKLRVGAGQRLRRGRWGNFPFSLNWAGFVEFGQIWSNLDEFGGIWFLRRGYAQGEGEGKITPCLKAGCFPRMVKIASLPVARYGMILWKNQ